MSSLETLAKLRVLVVHPADPNVERLTNCLRKICCDVEKMWPPPAELPADADVVYFLIDKRTRSSLPWLGGRPSAAVVAVVQQDTPDAEWLLTTSGVHGVITKPIDSFQILTSLSMAHSVFKYEGRLHTKVRKLEETLRSIRKVEQAKSILMKVKNIEEQEAYEYLRNNAMNKGLPIGSIASAVIDAEGLF